jgi:uncharacterized protein YdhG (YjbR/CyaY superfamily)
MPRRPVTPATVSAYIAAAPPGTRKILRQIRGAIRKAVPGVTERISYRIPTFDLDGRYLLYMAGFPDHVSIYPITSGMTKKYGEQLTPHRSGAGTLRFALDERVPLRLIAGLARVRVEERKKPEGRQIRSAGAPSNFTRS